MEPKFLKNVGGHINWIQTVATLACSVVRKFVFHQPNIYTLSPSGQSETIKGLVIGKNYYDFNRSGFKVQPNRGSENVRFDRKIDFSLSESLDSGSGFMQILPHLLVNTVYPRYFSVTAEEEEEG
ncbi:MAG: hypothetical protein AB1Z31_19680 [Desulfobacterales bacterium]